MRNEAAFQAEAEWLKTLGNVLREARLRAGLSVRQCAQLLGIAHQTVADAEGGSACRLSTLKLYIERVPGLSPATVLGLPSTGVPPMTDSVWDCMRSISGVVARRVRVHLTRARDGKRLRIQSVEGLNAVHASMADPLVRQALCRLACDAASPAFLMGVEAWPAGTTTRTADDGAVHEWSLDFRAESGISYRCRREVDEADPLRWSGGHPVEELELGLAGEGARAPTSRLRCWPAAAPPDPENDVAGRLHPDGVVVAEELGACVARVRHPAPQVTYALDVEGGPAPTPPSRLSLGELVHARRKELGLGLKSLGKRTSCRTYTLTRLECGGGAKANLLRRLVVELGIPPGDVLPPADVRDASELAAWYRQLYGVEAASISKVLRVYGDGRAESVIRTQGLHSLTATDSDLRLRIGLARVAAALNPWLLRSMETDVGDVSLRVVRRRQGATQHELRFPAGDALRRGLSYTRRMAKSKQFPMSHAEAVRLLGDDDQHGFGTSLAVIHPVRHLEVVVRFPRAFEPRGLRAHAWTTDMFPDQKAPVLSELPPLKLAIVTAERHVVARLAVDDPLVGFKYGIGWWIYMDSSQR